MLHIGEEGTRIFDFAAIIERVETTRLVHRAFANDTSP
jgi:hypothetical protein